MAAVGVPSLEAPQYVPRPWWCLGVENNVNNINFNKFNNYNNQWVWKPGVHGGPSRMIIHREITLTSAEKFVSDFICNEDELMVVHLLTKIFLHTQQRFSLSHGRPFVRYRTIWRPKDMLSQNGALSLICTQYLLFFISLILKNSNLWSYLHTNKSFALFWLRVVLEW